MAKKRLAKKLAKKKEQMLEIAVQHPTAPAPTEERIEESAAEPTAEAPVQEAALKEDVQEKKPAAKKGRTLKVNVCLQYQGKQVEEQEIIAKIKAWWKEQGNKIKDLETLDIYMKPEDGKAYFTINGTISGDISLF